MTTTDTRPLNGMWAGELTTELEPVKRFRGLRFPALPTMPALAQILGGAGALVGTYLQWGLAVAFIVGGVASVALGALREAGKV